MKKAFPYLVIQVSCIAIGYAKDLRWQDFGTPISTRPNLEVRWQVSAKFPRKIWVYRLLPNRFSPETLSNVLDLCSFTRANEFEQDTNGMIFQNPDGSRKLSILFTSGAISYLAADKNYGPTNLAEAVPPMSQLSELAKDTLRKLGIPLSEITGYFGTNKMEFLERGSTYYTDTSTVTNIMYRTAYFRRLVDGMPIVGYSYGFNFGEHSKITKITLTWPKLEHHQSYRALTPKRIMNLIREGKAVHGLVPDKIGNIDWSSVKSMTLKDASPSYYARNSDWLYPYLALTATVDTGRGDVDIDISCPIIDE